MKSSSLADDGTQGMIACLAVPSRFHLVRAIAGADLCVGELAIRVGLSQSCTTRHLQALERAGLVERRREGRHVRYRLHPEAGASRSLLDVVLGEERPLPAPAGRPVRRPRRHGAPSPDSIGRGKPLRKQALREDGGIGADEREEVRPETDEPRKSEPSVDGGGSVRVYRHQEIEDYLL